MEGFRKHKGLPGVRGAIDGSHIPVKAPQECPENYINRKNFHSVNLTAICDDEMRFLDCYAGWPGSVHDSRVLKIQISIKLSMTNSKMIPTSWGIPHTLWRPG